jgi:methylmalonyl-CoA mutase cobalamin-binding subunit
VLAWIVETYAPGPRAPRVVVATPAGELHELGAMLAAAAAAEARWRVVYLGASLPASDIAAAAAQVGARAVALSVVYADAGAALDEVRATAHALPPGTAIFVGGAAAVREAAALREAGARVLPDLPTLRRALRALRAAEPGRLTHGAAGQSPGG